MVSSKKKSMILHATTIDISGKGTSIIGVSGLGKSSLAIKLIAMGADLVSDDLTLFKCVDEQIFLSKPKNTPAVIEARGIGLIPVKKFINTSELFYFVKLSDEPVERLPAANNKFCFGKPIRLIHFNPLSGNEAALYLMLKYGLVDSTNLGQ